jgi:hypothetical protein
MLGIRGIGLAGVGGMGQGLGLGLVGWQVRDRQSMRISTYYDIHNESDLYTHTCL